MVLWQGTVCCWSFNLRVKAGCETLQIALHIAPQITILGWKFRKTLTQTPPPVGRGTPPPHTLPLSAPAAPRFLRLRRSAFPHLFFFYKLTTGHTGKSWHECKLQKLFVVVFNSFLPVLVNIEIITRARTASRIVSIYARHVSTNKVTYLDWNASNIESGITHLDELGNFTLENF